MEKGIFEQIANKEVNAYIVYEDDISIAFLAYPGVTKGHTLVIPKKKYENILEIEDETLSHIIKIVKKLSPPIMKAMGCDGVKIVQNNGKSAGQEVFHIHFHIIPRRDGDGVFIDKARQLSDEEYKIVRDKIIKNL